MTHDADRSPPLMFEVLGPVRVWRHGQELDQGPRQQQLVLALLLARAGGAVGTGEISSMLWGSQPPPSAVNILHRYVGNLRRLLEPGLGPRMRGRWIVSDAIGYRIVVDDKSLDLLSFRRLISEARAAVASGRPDAAMAAYVDALGLWRGPCAGAPQLSAEQADAFTAVDHELARRACEAADLLLTLDGGRSVLSFLRCLAANHPFDEALQARLMLALSAAGQRADALAVYQSLRHRLADELGVDPGAEIHAAYRMIFHSSNAPRRVAKPSARSRADGTTHTARLTVSSDDVGTNGQVRSSKYLDYSIQARWAALADAGLSIRELASAGVGPVELEVSIAYRQELVLGDEIDVVTRFEFPSPKTVQLVQSMVRRSDGVVAAVVTCVTGLMDLASRRLVDDAAGFWASFLRDPTVVGLTAPSIPDQLP